MSSSAETDQEGRAREEGVPEGDLIYRSVRQDGEHALSLPTQELVWSGLAAGLSMSFSFITEGLLRAHLPEASWTPLITKLGYAAGFLIVVLGRQQLFTEQTITAILPLLDRHPSASPANVTRLWTVVLLANLAGTFIVAAAIALTSTFSAETHASFSHIGNASLSHGFGTTFMRAIFAGYIIAVMIWLLPGAEAARLWIVIALAYVVGIGAFSHVIAGSTACLYVVLTGERLFAEYLFGFLAPAWAGNAVGGVVFVAALAHLQHGSE